MFKQEALESLLRLVKVLLALYCQACKELAWGWLTLALHRLG